MKNEMRTALIGCGRIGFLLEHDKFRNKPCTHFGGAKSAGISIKYACDINPQRLSEFAKLAKISPKNLFTDYSTLLQTIKPEIVIIAVWTKFHADIAIEAIKNGAKIIILEKPITGSITFAYAIKKIAKKYNTTIIVNHERRYDNRYRLTKHLLDSGKIGIIKNVNANVFTLGKVIKSDISEGGGPLLQDGTHLVDILRYFFGEINTVSGDFSRNGRVSGFEDEVHANLITDSGLHINLSSGKRDYFSFEIDIFGEKGRLLIGNGFQRLFVSAPSKLYQNFYDLKEVRFPKIKKGNCFTNLYKDVKNTIKEKNSSISTINDGIEALKIVHSIYASSYTKKPVSPKTLVSDINLQEIFSIKNY